MTSDEVKELTWDELHWQWVDLFLEVCAEADDQKRIALIEALNEIERQERDYARN